MGPAIVVAVLGGVSLRQWARASELLLREQARDMAAMAAAKVEMVLRRAEDEFLARLEGALASGDRPDAALAALLAREPLVRRLYLFDPRGELLYPRMARPEDAEAMARLLADVAPETQGRGGRRYLVADDLVVLAASVRSRAGKPLLAAIVPDLTVLRREVLERALGGGEGTAIVAVLDHRDRPLYSRASLDGADRVVAVDLREGLPQWRVALYEPRGLSPRETVRRQIAVFTAAFGVLIAVIVTGIVVTARLMRRETEMARLKADFVANVSHDLKTPLSVIRMFGETLELGRVTDEAKRREYYHVIARESERLSRLIDNVLDFSRIEGGRRTYDMVPTAVEPVIRDALDAFAYPLKQGGFKVEVDVASDLPEISMDADAIGQALANLIDNAIKYSGERRELQVGASVVDGHVALSVRDGGLGIPAEEQARIFDKFYRVGRSDTQGRRGSGVGLALVRHIVEAHGGRVTVESRVGAGSRFTLWLPLDRPGAG